MNPLRRWTGIRVRKDWIWETECQRPSLVLRDGVRPGWYMLTVQMRSEQLRCYGLLNRNQGRVLVNGKLRKRIVRISKGNHATHFEIQGLNGDPIITKLRLVPQPIWRVKRLLAKKLVTLHPGYRQDSLKRKSWSKLWRDYNRLLSHKSWPLVGYDEWIERVELGSLSWLDQSEFLESCQTTDNNDCISFVIWLWGKREDRQLCELSMASIERQRSGAFELLPPGQKLEDKDEQTWVVVLQVGDQLAPNALNRFAKVIQTFRDTCILYADEDRISLGGRRHSPQFKPAWNPDLLYTDPHYSHSWLIRSDHWLSASNSLYAAGERETLYGIALEATARCRTEQILHLPEVLYHRLDQPEEDRASAETAISLKNVLARRGQRVQVDHHKNSGHVIHWPLPDPQPLVSVIIATRDQGALLRCCLTSLAKHAQGNPPTELILIDNGSSEEATLDYLKQLELQDNIRVLRRPGKFNYAALNNEAVSLARGELIALMNNDVEATHGGWLRVMAAQACRSEIGAVGAKLLFPDGTIQHAGVLLGIGGVAGHAHKYLPSNAEGYQLRLRIAHNISAVTAAMLVVRKKVFEEVGGFDHEHFAVNYNDVDFCLRLMMAGYRNLFCPDAVLIHHESKSRGAPVTDEAFAQWQAERNAMVNRWGTLLRSDPNYSPHLSLLEENLSISLKPTSTAPRRALATI